MPAMAMGPAMSEPVKPEPPTTSDGAVLGLLVVDGVLLGALGLMLAPLYAGGVPVPMGVVLSVLIVPWLVFRAAEVDPRPSRAGAPLLAWVVVVAVLGLTGPGGDVMLPATWQSLLLVIGGIGSGCGPCGACSTRSTGGAVAEAIPDSAIVAVLRPFVRATRPVLDRPARVRPVRSAGACSVVRTTASAAWGRNCSTWLAAVEVPGTAAWAAMDVPARSRWWVHRVGRFTTLVAAVPGLGGALAEPASSVEGAGRRRSGAAARRDRGRARRPRRGRARDAAGRGDVPARADRAAAEHGG